MTDAELVQLVYRRGRLPPKELETEYLRGLALFEDACQKAAVFGTSLVPRVGLFDEAVALAQKYGLTEHPRIVTEVNSAREALLRDVDELEQICAELSLGEAILGAMRAELQALGVEVGGA